MYVCSALSPAGFFFGMRRSIRSAAFDASAGLLFDPSNVIIRQEGDLFDRMSEVMLPAFPSGHPQTGQSEGLEQHLMP